MSNQLKVLVKPCGNGSCPTIYQDDQGRVFVQGNKLDASARDGVAIANHEEVVEISPELLSYLRSNQI